MCEALRVVRSAFQQGPFCKCPGRFDKSHVIHQGQCLQWGVGTGRAYRADFARCGIHHQHAWWGYRSFPIGVQTAAVQVGSLVLYITGFFQGQLDPESGRLIRPDGGPAQLLRQEAAGGQGLVANHVG